MPATRRRATPVAAGEQPKATIRVDLDRVDRLIDLVGELVINGAMLMQRSIEAGLATPRPSPWVWTNWRT